jgi:hypothetical protein
MAELTVAVDADEINRYVSEAILNSVLGANLKKAIEAEVSKLAEVNRYNGPTTLEKVVHGEVLRILESMMHSEPLASRIRAVVEAAATDEVVEHFAATGWQALIKAVDRLKDSY